MSIDVPGPLSLERILAHALHYGTWLASSVIAAGLALALATWPGGAAAAPDMPLVTAGIALFILLPLLRIVLMLVVFLRERDYRMGGIALLVLAIVVLGFAVGALSRGPA